MTDNILTTSEVAALWRADRRTVVNWIKAGMLPAFQTPGGHYRIHREFAEAVDANRSGPLRRPKA
jgi:excisionase family DNA binding protein